MAGQMSAFVNHKGVVFWLMGLTILYQLAYQAIMWRALHDEDARDECGAPSSPSCVEIQLFRSWQRAAPVWQGITADGGDWHQVEDLTTAAPVAENQTAHLSAAVEAILAASESTRPTTSKMEAASETSAEELSTSAAPAKEWSPMTAWAQGLVDLQKQMEARLASLPSMRRKREADLSEQMDQHVAKITQSLQGSTLTRWGQDLQQLQHSMESKMAALPSQRHAHSAAGVQQQQPAAPSLMDQINVLHKEMCEAPHRRNETSCVEFLASMAAADGAAQDARRLERSAARAAQRARSQAELREHTAELEAGLAKIAAERDAWQLQFAGKVRTVMRELCQAPHRRDSPECAEALSEEVTPSARSAARAELRANITQEAKEHVAALDEKLAKMAADRKEWEKALLQHYGVAQASSTPEDSGASTTMTLWHGVPNLQWSKVAAWSKQKKLRGPGRGGGHPSVRRAELRNARWEGALPKVACITAVPSGHSAKTQIKYVVDSFNAQTYEGPKQLVLVYHYEDDEAAEVVQRYADGVYIKGVAALEFHQEFPSTSAFRFGAWSARDADVIAQWDFDEWHHAQRLSLQVRSLAYVGKPACLMRVPHTSTTRDKKEEDLLLWEGSLLGERSWMWEYWHPLIKEQHTVLEDAQASNIVALDMDAPKPPGQPAERLAAIRSSMDSHFERLLGLFENSTKKNAA